MRTPVELRFEKGDPVREYWLARGEGFVVENRRGRVVGQVVDVVVDPHEQRVMSLVVQKARGTTELPTDEIQAVVPARDTFVLDGAREPRHREERPRRRVRGERLARVRAALAPKLRRAGLILRAAGRILLEAGRSAALWAVGVVRLLAGELQRRPR
jgi:hypothetical protein